VIFSAPEKPSWFRAWIASQGITVDLALIRALPGSQMPGAWGWLDGSRDDPLPEHDEHEEEQRGVIGLWGRVEATQLPTIASDSSVFIADVTFTVVYRDLVEAGLVTPDSNYPNNMEGVQMTPWFSELPVMPMDELGIYTLDK